MTNTSDAQAPPSRRDRLQEQRERRRVKRDQVRQAYQDYTPPQVRRVRQQNWMDRINPEPQDVPWELDKHECPSEGCGKSFAKAGQLRAHIKNKHYPRQV